MLPWEIIDKESNYYNIDIKQAYITENENKHLVLNHIGLQDIIVSRDSSQIIDETK